MYHLLISLTACRVWKHECQNQTRIQIVASELSALNMITATKMELCWMQDSSCETESILHCLCTDIPPPALLRASCIDSPAFLTSRTLRHCLCTFDLDMSLVSCCKIQTSLVWMLPSPNSKKASDFEICVGCGFFDYTCCQCNGINMTHFDLGLTHQHDH